MDSYTFNQTGNGNVQIMNADSAKLAEDLKRSRAWADELAHLMAGAIETREKAKDALRKQIRHTIRARKQRDEMKAEIVAMREELAALKAEKPAVRNPEVAPVTGIPATGNRVLTLEEVLALEDENERTVWVECRTGAGRSTGTYIVLAGLGALMNTGETEEFFIFGNWLAGFLGKYARVWSHPQEPTQAEKDANPWGKEGE